MPLGSWWLLAAIFLSALVTAGARRYALRRNLLDHPGGRRSHVVATPRGGGIAIVTVLLLACAVAVFIWPDLALYPAVFALGLLMVAGIGWWDDHRPRPALARLAVHAVASLLLAWIAWRAGAGLVHVVLVALFAVSLVNIWNFMDGINGLAVTQAILVAVGLALLLPAALAWAGWVLAAACLGFLPFNFPKARIFLGDVGSGALGYALAALVALSSMVTSVSWILLVVPMTAFLVDAGFTLLSRILAGERWMEAHRQHLYQRLVQAGASHGAVTLWYSVFTVFGITLAAIIKAQPVNSIVAAMGGIAWIALAIVLWWFARRNIH